MAASDYVPTFFKKPLALGGASTDEYTVGRWQFAKADRMIFAMGADVAFTRCFASH